MLEMTSVEPIDPPFLPGQTAPLEGRDLNRAAEALAGRPRADGEVVGNFANEN
jgi:hypothetical protein